MYARLILFTIGPGKRAVAEKMVVQFAPALRSRKGFKGATFLADDSVGEYGSLVLWETKEDAEDAAKNLFPEVQKALSGLVKEPPRHPLFEVVEVKT